MANGIGNIPVNELKEVQDLAKNFEQTIAQVDKKFENINDIVGDVAGKLQRSKDLQKSSTEHAQDLAKHYNKVLNFVNKQNLTSRISLGISTIILKFKKNNYIIKNNNLMLIQTPQAFSYKIILKAHKTIKNFNAKDDTSLTEKIGFKTKFIKGCKTNIKITHKEDLNMFNLLKKRIRKFGIGYDIHKIDFISKKKLILCGVKINHAPLIGHSDADVGYHAICDSILGSLSLKDIGYYFKNNDKRWKNVNSKIFLLFAANKLKEKKYRIINLDINYICQTPQINKYIKKIIFTLQL